MGGYLGGGFVGFGSGSTWGWGPEGFSPGGSPPPPPPTTTASPWTFLYGERSVWEWGSGGVASGSSGPLPYSPPIPTPYRDDDAYDAIITLLIATNEFDGVVRSTDPDLARVTAEEARVIILDPGVGGSTSPQPSPYRLLRQPTYTLTIKVRAEEFEDSRAELDRLYAVVENTLLYQSYGGFTIPRLSTLYQDRYSNAAHPDSQIQLRGQFGYIRVLPGGGFRTTY